MTLILFDGLREFSAFPLRNKNYHTIFIKKPLNFSTRFTFASSFSSLAVRNSFVFNPYFFDSRIFFFHCIFCSFSRFISFLLCFVSSHDFNVSKIIFISFPSLQSRTELFFSFNCIYGTKITTTNRKRQSSSVGWKLRKIICYDGKYKGNFLLVAVCAWIWERLLLRFSILSHFHVSTGDNFY